MNIEELKMVVELLGGLGDKAFTAFIIYAAVALLRHLAFAVVIFIIVKMAIDLGKTVFLHNALMEQIRDIICPRRFSGSITTSELQETAKTAIIIRRVYEDHERNKAQSERQPYCES